MLAYYGYTISPNQIETGEGFLICKNVPIARTGDQEYLGREIGLDGAEADKVLSVLRAPEEVFAPAALASFEGKPVTNDHPPDLIGPDDVKLYEMGHAQNVRRGQGEWGDYVVADLHIHDRELIEAIQQGKREISCGYECEYVQNEDGTYSQKNIRGNHIAVVERGRAGKLAAILDSDTVKKEQAKRPERKAMKKNGLLFKLFGQAVKDKSPEEIEQLAMDAADALEAEDESNASEGGQASAGETKKEETGDSLGAAGVNTEALTAAIVKQVMAQLNAGKEEKANPIDEAIEKLSSDESTGAAEGEAQVVPAEEMDDKQQASCGIDRAVAVAILKKVRPAVAAIKDEAQRKAVSDALIASVTDTDAASDIAKVIQTAQKNAKTAADRKPEANLDEIQKMYDNLNPHRREQK